MTLNVAQEGGGGWGVGVAGGMVIVSEHLSHMMLDFTTGNINILVLSY